jgi:hypothetical protein
MISGSNLHLIRTHATLIFVRIFFAFPRAQIILQGLVFLNFYCVLPLLPAFACLWTAATLCII